MMDQMKRVQGVEMGQPNHVHLVELGPGRGTLWAPSWLIFSDPALKSIQQQTLKCHPKDQADSTCAVDGQEGKPTEDQISQISGAAISWHLDLEHVPRGG
ncbi:unnamed protein product [Sphagnum tenellum]